MVMQVIFHMLITDFLTHVNKEVDFPIYHNKTVNNTIKFVDNNPFAETYLSSYTLFKMILNYKKDNNLILLRLDII